MKIHQKSRVLARLVLFPVILLAALFAGIRLWQPVNAEGGASYTLQISPSSSKFDALQPGQTAEGVFELQNTGKDGYHYKVTVTPYTVSGENYAPNYEKTTQYTEIVDWITLETESGYINANENQKIRFTIAVPEDAPGQGQSAAIIVTLDENSDAGGNSVQTVNRAAHILAANVAGETRTTGSVSKNNVPSFLFEPPVVATSIVENTGNVYTDVSYTLEVRSLLGDNLVYTNASTQDGETVAETRVVFPETSRYNEISWDGAPQLGLFKVKQTVQIFDEISEVEKIVFLCPIWFLVILIAIAAIIVYEIVSNILRLRRDRAIKKALDEKSAPKSDETPSADAE